MRVTFASKVLEDGRDVLPLDVCHDVINKIHELLRALRLEAVTKGNKKRIDEYVHISELQVACAQLGPRSPSACSRRWRGRCSSASSARFVLYSLSIPRVAPPDVWVTSEVERVDFAAQAAVWRASLAR